MKRLLLPATLFAMLFLANACATESGSTAAAEDNTLTKAEESAGRVLLFDGKSLEHWRGFKKDAVPAAWQAEDGALVLAGKGGGDIVTKDAYENFELTLDWKISEGGNSGVFFNVSEDPEFKSTWQTGPEIQVMDDERHPGAKQGKNNNRQAGTNYDLHPLAVPAVKPAGEFNIVRLLVKNGHVQHCLNGKKVVNYTLWSPEWEAMVKEIKYACLRALQKRAHSAAGPRLQSMV